MTYFAGTGRKSTVKVARNKDYIFGIRNAAITSPQNHGTVDRIDGGGNTKKTERRRKNEEDKGEKRRGGERSNE